MRTDEFKARLEAMSEDEFAQFRFKFGDHSTNSRQWYVENYVTAKETWEPRLCHLFGIPTEQDRLEKAALDSAGATIIAADAAVKSENHARKANEIAERTNRLSFWSIMLSVFALVVSAIAILIAALKP